MEEANEKEKDDSKDIYLFGPSMDTFIKTRRKGKKKSSGNKSRCINKSYYEWIALKLPDQVQRIYDEAMRCYINLDYDKVLIQI